MGVLEIREAWIEGSSRQIDIYVMLHVYVYACILLLLLSLLFLVIYFAED